MKHFSRVEIIEILRASRSTDVDVLAELHGFTSAQFLVWKGKFGMQESGVNSIKKRYQETRTFHAARVLSKEDAAVLINTVSSLRVKGADGREFVISKAKPAR